MKYWRGFIVAGALALLTYALTQFAAAYGDLIDMVYPYISRIIQDSLAQWSAGAAFCLWQVLAIMLAVIFLSSIVLMLVLRWNPIQWLGWVLAGVCLIWCLHTGVYGLNQYSSPLADDIRLDMENTHTGITGLVNATTYFRDKANELALQVERNADGSLKAPTFEESANQAADGFHKLVYEENLAVFAGVTTPVKELGFADMYSSMGIAGFTMPLTGEAAVNPQTPTVALPFIICHEMCHRMCIAPERDANLGAYLATTSNSDLLYQYSGYFMAFRYCYNSLASLSTSTAINAANSIYGGINPELMKDLNDYRSYYASVRNDQASGLANSVNNAYIQASGDPSGTQSYGEVTDLLVAWYLQEIALPTDLEEEEVFDPFDKDYVFGEGLEEEQP